VATVDGDPITEADIVAMAGVFGEALIDLTPDEQRAYLIDALITLRLMVHAGQAQAMDQEPDFLAQMEQLRQRLLQSIYVGRTVEALVTEEAARARYAELVAARAIPEEVYARHIQVATEAEAYDILRLLADGEDFAALAQSRSIDTLGGPRGGELCDTDRTAS
jgi:peptidyl-prolyl cis-trans isomerase C